MQQGTPEYDHMAQERAFVERLQQKDAGAWKTLVVDYHPFLEQVIRRSLSKRNLPLEYKDDIEAKTWFTAFGKIKSFSPREPDSLRNWLSAIQHQHVRSLSRGENTRATKENQAVVVDDEGYELPDTNAPSPENQFIYDETQREIWQAVDLAMREELSPRDREIILLRFLHRKSVDELALIYGLQRQTVYQIVSKSTQRLYNYLSANELFRNSSARKETSSWKK